MTTKYESTYELYLLHSRADRVMRALLAEKLEPYDATLMEWLLLGTIYHGPSDGMSMSSLADELDVTLPQITALISSLAKKRLIKQKTQKQDRRSRHATTTSRGHDVFKKIEADVAEAHSLLFKDINPDDAKTYIRVLEAVSSYNAGTIEP